jgi:glutamate/tyrosine decarboxylase-like PLP-dependent enzyme
MVSLGKEGYRAIASDIFRTAAELVSIIDAQDGVEVIGDPLFNVAFRASADEGLDIFLVNDALARKRWRLNGLQDPAAVHFCITRPNTAPGVMDRFRDDLAEAVRYAREHKGERPRSGAVYAGGVAREAVAAGMVGWLDATQALPPG